MKFSSNLKHPAEDQAGRGAKHSLKKIAVAVPVSAIAVIAAVEVAAVIRFNCLSIANMLKP